MILLSGMLQWYYSQILQLSSILIFWMTQLSPILIPPANLGCNGSWRAVEGPCSMRKTDDMGGLSVGTSWAHKSPTWMHLKTSSLENSPIDDGSIFSTAVPFLQCSRACMRRRVNYFFGLGKFPWSWIRFVEDKNAYSHSLICLEKFQNHNGSHYSFLQSQSLKLKP